MSRPIHEREAVEGKFWQILKFRDSLVPSGVKVQCEGTAGSGVTDGKTTALARQGRLIKPPMKYRRREIISRQHSTAGVAVTGGRGRWVRRVAAHLPLFASI
jgi:hypothetical protein